MNISHAIKPRSAKEEAMNQRLIAERKAELEAARQKEADDIEDEAKKYGWGSTTADKQGIRVQTFKAAIKWYKRYKNL